MTDSVDKDDVEDLDALFKALFPDPVDIFENRRAAELGLHRHPSLGEEDWRRLRVAAINAADEGEESDQEADHR